ncbi:MAG: Cholesterol dehydrogenase [Gammaproteobacteria bacterium]|nr:Cholesterol dehydrogenase [Gammaproteobacteria bacterium]
MTAATRALVTGAGGFIGSHFVRFLAGRGWGVRAIDVRESPNSVIDANVQYRVQDVRDEAALSAALDGVDYVFNLASVHLDVHATVEQFESVNVTALERLVELSSIAGVRRLVQVSSVGVYGHVASPPAKEDAPLNPENAYERTKAAGEAAARRSAVHTGLDLVVVRPSWVYGAGCPRTTKLIHALRKGRFFYIGKGRNLRHPVYVDDLLAALELTARAGPEIAGRTFNIAGPRWMTVEEMVAQFAQAIDVRPPTFHAPRWLGITVGWAAEQVSAVVGAEPPVSRRTLAFFENDNAFDIGAARSAFGFEPLTDLPAGVRKLAAVSALGR